MDQPIAGLLKDLKARGLLEDTLVIWGGEFGRTPVAQAGDGRDHNPYGYTIWMAGGGVKTGFVYGATDEFGYHAVEDRMHIHDFHATMLHLLGLDHEQLTYRYGGRDFRLTDVARQRGDEDPRRLIEQDDPAHEIQHEARRKSYIPCDRCRSDTVAPRERPLLVHCGSRGQLWP